MTGLLARIQEQPPEVLDAIANSMEVRASEPAMQAICARYMARITLPERARVLEVGCGSGAATKLIMQHVSPAQLVQSVEPHGYLLTLLSRGAHAAVQADEIGQELVDSFDREARRRVANGTFYGAMLFLSLTARTDG